MSFKPEELLHVAALSGDPRFKTYVEYLERKKADAMYKVLNCETADLPEARASFRHFYDLLQAIQFAPEQAKHSQEREALFPANTGTPDRMT